MSTPTPDFAPMIAVLRDARGLLARAGNDFAWSPWDTQTEALAEIDRLIARLEAADPPERSSLNVLFLATGPIQEVSLSSGWGDEFLALAKRFDKALLRSYGRDPRESGAHRAQLTRQWAELFGGGLRWFHTVMCGLAGGFALVSHLSGDSMEIHFPFDLRGPAVGRAMLLAAAFFGFMAVVNWVAWLKQRER